MTPEQFISKWRRSRGQEAAGAQEWFIDLCRVVEHGTPNEMDQLRENWLNPVNMLGEPALSESQLRRRTLTNLYNEYPTWLRNAHEKLDAAVADAYGWQPDLTDEEILDRLLALNLERAAAEAVRNEDAQPPS